MGLASNPYQGSQEVLANAHFKSAQNGWLSQMAAQTVTNKVGKAMIGRLSAMQQDTAGATVTDIDVAATVTLTLVYTTATGAITLDRSAT